MNYFERKYDLAVAYNFPIVLSKLQFYYECYYTILELVRRKQ